MDEAADRLVEGLAAIDTVANQLTPEEAAAAIDAATLQSFWRDWPQVSSWAGALWRRLNEDLAAPAAPQREPDVDEVGGEGG